MLVVSIVSMTTKRLSKFTTMSIHQSRCWRECSKDACEDTERWAIPSERQMPRLLECTFRQFGKKINRSDLHIQNGKAKALTYYIYLRERNVPTGKHIRCKG
jgi:hypothetical protein